MTAIYDDQFHMKLIVIFSFFMGSQAEMISVNDLSTTDFEFMFSLKNSKYDLLLLDCQSFIHGIRAYNTYQEKFVLQNESSLSSNQCFNLFKTLDNGPNPICLDFDWQRGSYQFKKNCSD